MCDITKDWSTGWILNHTYPSKKKSKKQQSRYCARAPNETLNETNTKKSAADQPKKQDQQTKKKAEKRESQPGGKS